MFLFAYYVKTVKQKSQIVLLQIRFMWICHHTVIRCKSQSSLTDIINSFTSVLIFSSGVMLKDIITLTFGHIMLSKQNGMKRHNFLMPWTIKLIYTIAESLNTSRVGSDSARPTYLRRSLQIRCVGSNPGSRTCLLIVFTCKTHLTNGLGNMMNEVTVGFRRFNGSKELGRHFILNTCHILMVD